MAHAGFTTSIDSTLARVMAERIEQEFGIDRGKLSGIAQDGVTFDFTANGAGMVSVTYIGFVTREQYDRITAAPEGGTGA